MTIENFPTKHQLILRSLAIASGLTCLKLIVFVKTQSLAMLASAADSFMDFLISFINFLFLKGASKPADDDHAYGHGKLESLAGLLQSVVMAIVTIGIAVLSIQRFFNPQSIRDPYSGIGVSLLALGFNLWHIRNLKKSMVDTGSQVMATEYVHYASDTLIYVGVLISFFLFQVTGLFFWDPLISIVIILYLAKNIAGIMRDSINELLDKQLDETILAELDQTIRTFHPQIVDYHDLRTRKVGPKKFIEFHVVLRGVQGFIEAHDLTEQLIRRIRSKFSNSVVTVHSDPEGVVEPDMD